TGLDDSRARAYSPTLSRFVQADPSGLGPDVNAYRYEQDGPTGAVDPSGLRAVYRAAPDEAELAALAASGPAQPPRKGFLVSLGNGLVELPLMFWDAGHAVYAAAYMDLYPGEVYIPRYRSMMGQAADQASVRGGRDAVGQMMAESYKDLASLGV